MLQSLGALTLGVLSCLVSERSNATWDFLLEGPVGREHGESDAGHPLAVRALRQMCEWGQRLGGHSSPSRYLMKKNQREQPTALLRPRYIWPLLCWLRQLQLLLQPPRERQDFYWSKNPSLLCPARTSDPQNCEHSMWLSFTAINNQTPGNRLALGWPWLM